MDALRGRVTIVTGSDSGIGRAIARAFADEGADVVITWLHDEASAVETADYVRSLGHRALSLRLDQRDPESVEALFHGSLEQLGMPFVLVNNAGIEASGEVADLSLDDWENVLRTNLTGPFLCCQQFIRLRRTAGGHGRIINVTSVHEEIAMPEAAAYNASKGGLRNLTRTLCLELAPDRINVNNLAPGMVLTPLNRAAMDDPEVRARQTGNIPWKRAAEPSEVARLAVYLASDEADYVTGQTFTIDGGLSMNVGQGA